MTLVRRGAFRALLFCLALCHLSTALAADLVLLPTGPVTADGQPTTVRLWGAGVDATAKLKVKATGATVSSALPQADGTVLIELSPEAVSAPGQILISVKGKGAAGEIAAELQVPVVPAWQGGLKPVAEPSRVLVGVDSDALIRITAPPGPQSVGQRKLLVHSNIGVIDTVTPSGDGSFVARWRPPAKVDRSQFVVITAVDAAAPDQVWGWMALPLVVRKPLTLQAPAGATNVLKVGDRTWGPLPTAANGTVTFDADLPPAFAKGMLQSSVGGQAQSKEVDLGLGETPRFTFVSMPTALPADPARPYQVTLLALSPDGQPWTGAAPAFSASAGVISGASPGGAPGLFVARYTPDPRNGPVTISATMGGQKFDRTLQLVSPLPSLTLTADPPRLGEGQKDVALRMIVKDSKGTALPGQLPELVVDGGAKGAKVVDNKDGTYAGTAKLSAGADSMRVLAEPVVGASGLGPSRLLGWSSSSWTPAGGAPVMVAFVVTDSLGLPVPGVDLQLSVPLGDGIVKPAAKTDARGVAAVIYNPGPTPGPAAVRATGAGFTEEVPLFQTGGRVGAPAAELLPADPALATWQKGLGLLQIWGPQKAPVVASAPPAPGPVAQPGAPAPAPAMGSSAAPEASVQKQRGGGGGGGSRFFLSGAIASLPHVYEMEGEGNIDVASPVSFENGNLFGGRLFGGFGADARALVWFDQIGADVRARFGFERFELAEDNTSSGTAWSAAAGARYRGSFGPEGMYWYGLGQVHRLSSPIFTFTDPAHLEVEVQSVGKVGLRLGGGLGFEGEKLYTEFELAETFAALPSDSYVGLELGYAVQDNLLARLGLSADFRHVRADVDGAEVDIRDQEHAVQLGITARFD